MRQSAASLRALRQFERKRERARTPERIEALNEAGGDRREWNSQAALCEPETINPHFHGSEDAMPPHRQSHRARHEIPLATLRDISRRHIHADPPGSSFALRGPALTGSAGFGHVAPLPAGSIQLSVFRFQLFPSSSSVIRAEI
jgi:hypothetical protein